jgi:hypothetical protein
METFQKTTCQLGAFLGRKCKRSGQDLVRTHASDSSGLTRRDKAPCSERFPARSHARWSSAQLAIDCPRCRVKRKRAPHSSASFPSHPIT